MRKALVGIMNTAPLAEAERLITEFETANETELTGLKKTGGLFFQGAEKVERSFSGSCLGYHALLYFDRFQPPAPGQRFSAEWGTIHGMPDGWSERTPEEVKAEIERLAGGADLDHYEKEIEELKKRAATLRDDLLSYLSVVVEDPGLAAEKAALPGLSAFTFGRNKQSYIEANLIVGIGTRDSGAAMEGARIPAHLYFQAISYEGTTSCDAVVDFLAKVKRLVRQIRLKTAHGTPVLKKEDLRDLHPEVFEK